MIYIILFIVVIAVSAFLAFRSMKSFQEVPSIAQKYSLFLLKNPQAIAGTLTKLYAYSLSNHLSFSLEVLLKGKQVVLALYAPTSIVNSLEELSPVEIEDYLNPGSDQNSSAHSDKKTKIDEAYSWVIQSKNNPKKALSVSPQFLRMAELEENQKFFWQLVLTAIKADTPQFQATIRAIVEESDPIKRVELVKRMDKEIELHTGLTKNLKQQSSGAVFLSFKERSLTPKESSPFILSPQEVKDLLGSANGY